jgi:hypothetical protein
VSGKGMGFVSERSHLPIPRSTPVRAAAPHRKMPEASLIIDIVIDHLDARW